MLRSWPGRLAAAVCLGALWQATPTLIALAQPPGPATATPQPAMHMAVVDLPSLVKQHPDYDQLKQLEETMDVQEKKVQLIPHESEDRARKKVGDRMRDELEKAHAEMKAAEVKVRADLDGLGESYQNQLKTQLEGLKTQAGKDLESAVKKYKDEHSRGATAAPRGGGMPPDLGNRDLMEYRKNMLLMRARLLAAHRLEIERNNSNDFQAERSRLDKELGAYEDQVATKYQQDKINDQLKMQVTKDEGEQKKIQDDLAKISEAVANAKAKKREAVDAEFSAFQAKRKAELETNVRDYRRRVDDDVINRLGLPPRGSTRQAVAVHPTGETKGPPPEIVKMIASLQGNIKAQMEAKSAEIKTRMQGEQAQARAKLEAKRKEIDDRLHKIQADLIASVTDQEHNLDAATKAKLEQAKAALKKTSAEHDALLKKMLADIRGAVGKVADKEKVPMVIGDVFYSGSGIVDLTDLSMVAIKEMRH